MCHWIGVLAWCAAGFLRRILDSWENIFFEIKNIAINILRNFLGYSPIWIYSYETKKTQINFSSYCPKKWMSLQILQKQSCFLIFTLANNRNFNHFYNSYEYAYFTLSPKFSLIFQFSKWKFPLCIEQSIT